MPDALAMWWPGGGPFQVERRRTDPRSTDTPPPASGAAPNLIAAYYVQSAGQSASTLTTPSFTPTAGEVLVVKMETWDTGTSMGSVTGGGQTYTPRVVFAPGGFRPWVGITTAVVAGSPGSMTVSATPSISARCSMVVERWSNGQLAATPTTATDQGGIGTGAAHTNLTTTATDSVISWVAGDAQSVDPATRTYLGSATDEGVRDDHVGTNGVGYHGWAAAPSAGSQAFGLATPINMQWCIAGVEVLSAGGGGGATLNVDGNLTLTANCTGDASRDVPTEGDLPITTNLTGTAGRLVDTAGNLQITATPNGAAALAIPASGTLSITAGRTSTTATSATASGNRAVTAALSAAAAADRPGAGHRPTTVALTGDAAIVGRVDIDGNLGITVPRTGDATVQSPITIGGNRPTTANRTGAAAVTKPAAGTLNLTAARTGVATLTTGSPGTLPLTITLTGVAEVTGAYIPALVGVDSSTTTSTLDASTSSSGVDHTSRGGTFDSSSRQPADHSGTSRSTQVDL